MIPTAIGFFALAAILGMLLLGFVLKGKHTPKAIVFTHGPLAAIGLLLLVIYCISAPGPMESMILFLVAAAGGIIMVVRDLMGKTIPKWLAVVHGLVAAAGLVFLLIFQFG
jgi:hypothetical protein